VLTCISAFGGLLSSSAFGFLYVRLRGKRGLSTLSLLLSTVFSVLGASLFVWIFNAIFYILTRIHIGINFLQDYDFAISGKK